MRTLRFLIWTVLAVGLGVFLATFEIDGRTPLEHGQRFWKRKVSPSKLDQLKDKVGDTFSRAKDSLGKERLPTEHHTPEDRDALNKLIAKRAGEP